MAFSQVLDRLLRVLPFVGHILVVCWFIVVNGEDVSTTTEAANKLTSNDTNGSKQNKDTDKYDGFKGMGMSQQNMYRMLVVLITITGVTICFFVCKHLTSKRAKKAKKYGVLATSGADVELRPLDDDEEDEEDVFNVNR